MRRMSVRPSRPCIVSKRMTVDHILIFFSPSGIYTILVFPYQTLWIYSDGDPLTEAKISIFDQYLALELMTACVSSVGGVTL